MECDREAFGRKCYLYLGSGPSSRLIKLNMCFVPDRQKFAEGGLNNENGIGHSEWLAFMWFAAMLGERYICCKCSR